MDYKKAVDNIRYELKMYITENKIESLVIGISGGIDSAICAALAQTVCAELDIPLYGRSLTISTNKADEKERANKVGAAFCQNYNKNTRLESAYKDLWETVNFEGWGEKIAFRKGNIKARLRMIYLYDLAQTHNGMVLSTDNWTEYLLGFWTLHGDVGDYGMIQELWKTEVYDMAQWMLENEYNTPEKKEQHDALKSTIECHATDGLGISKTDLDQILPNWIGTSREGYKAVDKTLSVHRMMISTDPKARQEYIDKHKNCPVLKRFLRSKFKRNNPFNIPLKKIEGI